jgi:hypothetical protein
MQEVAHDGDHRTRFVSNSMIPMLECRWRDEGEADRHLCRSTKYLDAPNVVYADFCAECRYVDHDPAPPLPPGLPCVHLGGHSEDANEPGRLPTLACAVHGRCTVSGNGADQSDRVAAVRWCGDCPDYLTRDPFGPDSAAMRRRAEAYLAGVPNYPADRYQGRGVVIAGGGDRYFASLYVTIRALRHHGCRLPIQVWYLGRNNEMPADKQAILAPHEVECIDADQVRLRHPARILNGWELKAFAALHSPFEDVLSLDADCYPCRNPDFLFEQTDYRTLGAIFWPDMETFDWRLKWHAFGVADPNRPGSIESGQFVVNKRLCWRPLQLTWFYNNHSDYYYRYCHGDKHTFEVAWARCRQPFVMWQPLAKWAEVAYVHPGPDGDALFVHRCADKLRLDRHDYITHQNFQEPVFHGFLPLERECWGWMAELAGRLGRELRVPVFSEPGND